jgi:hypothetical protein
MFRKLIDKVFKKSNEIPYQFSDEESKRHLISFDGYVGYTGIGKAKKDGKDMYVFYIAFPQREKEDAVAMSERMVRQISALSDFHKQLKFSGKSVYELAKKLENLIKNI